MDILAFVLIVLLPGYLLTKLLFERLEDFALLPLSFVLGLLLLSPLALVSFIFRLSFAHGFLVILGYILLLFLLTVKRGALLKGISFSFDFPSKLLLVIVTGLIIGMFWVEPNLDGDALFHIANIRILAENSPLTPFEAMFSIEKVNPAYGFNIWYYLVAFIAFISGYDTVEVWSNLIFILVPVVILSVFTFSTTLFRDKFLGITTALVFLFLIYYSAVAWEFRIAPYPDQVARHIVLFVALYFFWKYIFGREKRYFYLTVFSGFLLSTIHLYSWLHLMISVGAFGLASLVFLGKTYFKKSLFLLAIPVISVPYLWLKLENAGTVVGTVTLKKDALRVLGDFFVIDPLGGGPLIILIFLALGILFFKFRKSISEQPWLVFLLANSLAAVFILYNPFVSRFVAEVISYTYFHRLVYLYHQEFILAAFIVFVVFLNYKKEKVSRQLKQFYLLSSVCILILVPFLYNETAVVDPQELEFRKLANFVETNLPTKSIFLADYWTSLRIPAYTNNYIVATFATHTTSNVNVSERIKEANAALSYETTLNETKIILEKYQVDYVVVNSQPKLRDIIADPVKFENQDGFEEVYSSEVYKVYLFNK